MIEDLNRCVSASLTTKRRRTWSQTHTTIAPDTSRQPSVTRPLATPLDVR